MKKKNNISVIVICLITFLSAGIISLSNTILTQRQKYFVEAPDVYP